MLAKETDAPFSDKDWLYEIKWDGYRAIAEVHDENVRLYSRNGNTFDASYPYIFESLQALGIDAVLDGEIVAMDENGKSDFQLLQQYDPDSTIPLHYKVFDLLELNGTDTTDLPLTERKALLKKLLPKHPLIDYSDHIEARGEDFFNAARSKDLEGIMAKKADSLYHTGTRTSEWLKIKHHKSQEAVIAGYTAPGGSRKNFGALVLGAYNGPELIYIGHTGTGFTTQALKDMSAMLKPLVQSQSPFEEVVKTNQPVTWVKPKLVCEIKYTEWTSDGRMRHPVFLRLRPDKKPSEVTMQNSKPVKPATKRSTAKAATKKSTARAAAKKEAPATRVARKSAASLSSNDKEQFISFGKTRVKVTNLQKVFWPDEGYTKGDVINYYISVSKYILPFLKDRPESLKRNPNGIRDFGFFHKDAGDEAPAWVKSKPIFSESANKDIDYIICNDQPTLTYLNNLGCIEINPWHSTLKDLDKPDYLIIDIDPADKNTFEQVIETANVIRDILKRAGAESYCKTSGATGLHVYVPTAKKYTYDQLKDFAHLVCIIAQEELPAFTSLERNLKKRGNKMIYLDHLQNRRGQTISSVYSLRPKPGAPVSMPLKWSEVKPGLDPLQFNIRNALKRIEKQAALFTPVLGKGIDLKKCLDKLNPNG